MISIKVLVTGGSGLLGLKLAEVGQRQGHHVILGYNNHVLDRDDSIKLDVTDIRSISESIQRLRPDYVVHAAALTDVDLCEKEQDLAYKINVEGTKNVVNLSNQLESSLVFVSTDYVFSGEKGDYSEDDETLPINVYGRSKLNAEEEVKSFSRDWCIVRPSVIYGSTLSAGKVNFALWLVNKLKTGEKVRIITDQWVSPTLNTNLAEMIFDIIENKHQGLFHLAGASQISRYDFALEIARELELDEGLIQPSTSKDMKWLAKRPINSSLNVYKAKRCLNVKPINISEALRQLRNELRSNLKK